MTERISRRVYFVTLVGLFFLGSPAATASLALSHEGAPARVANFTLMDHQGRFHELYGDSDARAIVLVWHGNGCSIVRLSLPKIRKLEEKYSRRGVRFFLVNANPQDDLEGIRSEAEAFDVRLPILKDETQWVTRSLGVTRTAEAVLIDPKHRTVAYRGPMDDEYDYGLQRPRVGHEWLNQAIGRFLAVGVPQKTEAEVKGCLIRFPGPVGSADVSPSYVQDVAPILKDKCLSCHSPHGGAPWAMESYETVNGWAPMIREAILTKRMPPWQIDPRYGSFVDDFSLNPEEEKILLRWLEAGAPRGDGKDPLKEIRSGPSSEWPWGEPDLIVPLPEQKIPAKGPVDYRYLSVPSGLTRDRWIRAAFFLPSNPKAMHHGSVFIQERRKVEAIGREADTEDEDFITIFVPGQTQHPYPQGTGRFLSKGCRFRFELHYIATGRTETDQPRLGLYFSQRGKPLKELFTVANEDRGLKIPPRVSDYSVKTRIAFQKDVLVYAFLPHMHYRGKRARYIACYPDGSQEVLLSIPRYDFDWQRLYQLKSPKRLPAGTVIETVAVFDNSKNNPRNPDPNRWVPWGKMTTDEMMLFYVTFSEAGKD